MAVDGAGAVGDEAAISARISGAEAEHDHGCHGLGLFALGQHALQGLGRDQRRVAVE